MNISNEIKRVYFIDSKSVSSVLSFYIHSTTQYNIHMDLVRYNMVVSRLIAVMYTHALGSFVSFVTYYIQFERRKVEFMCNTLFYCTSLTRTDLFIFITISERDFIVT